MKKKPDEAATTHPALVAAVAEKVAAAGAQVLIADSPGGSYNENILKGIYSACGYNDLQVGESIKLNYDVSSVEVEHEQGKVTKKLTVIKPIHDADLVINIPKLKTHIMMTYTGAVKNLFGIIPGALKAEYHIRMQDKRSFSDLLVDICDCIKPSISIMDAVSAMEGEGPSAGNPRDVGMIIASTSPYALDVVASSIIGLKPENVPTIARARERGKCNNLDEIEFSGENIKDCYVKDFKLPKISREITFSNNKILKAVVNYLQPRIVFEHEKCIVCRRCIKHCPAKAVTLIDNKPSVNSNKCIRCFCCHELCPQKAINIKKNWLLTKIINN